MCCPALLACGNHSGEAERLYGIGLKPFGFIPEPVFTIIPESCSDHPGTPFGIIPESRSSCPGFPTEFRAGRYRSASRSKVLSACYESMG